MQADPEILFEEKQKFNQVWLWFLLMAVNALFLFGLYKQMVLGQPFGDDPVSDTGLVSITAFVLLLSWLFTRIKLETRIKSDGVYVRFSPFHLKYRFYPWETLAKAYVRQYSAIMEYGGWGMRLGLLGSGRAFNISGDMGLQLQFKDGKKLLIGTLRPEELQQALIQLGQLKQ